jgi:multidrug efflux system outer membrane protein
MMGAKMKSLAGIVTLALMATMTGCMVGPDFEKPVMETPAEFRFAEEEPEAVVNLKWWELFEDPVLHSLVAIALNENKDVWIAASRIEEARAALGFVRADLYPRLDIGAGAFRGDFIGTRKVERVETNHYIAPVASWEIDFWGKFRRATAAARADLMASEFSLRTLQISLISEVVGAYFLLLDYDQRLQISKQTLESRIKYLDIIQKRFDKGIIPEIDLNQAQIQKEIAAESIPAFERLVARTENALSILLGRFPGEVQRGVDLYRQPVPPQIPVGLPSALLERRPDVARAEYILQAETERIGVAQALRFPAINLTGILGFASSELSELLSDGDAYYIAGELFGPIFNFNQDKMRVLIQEERTKQALYNYQNTVLLAFRDVDDALVGIQTYKKQMDSVKRRYKAAKNADTLSKLRYDKGVTSYLEVLDSKRALFNVQLGFSELDRLYHNAYVALYKALGGGWLSEEEMEQAQAAAQKEAEKK